MYAREERAGEFIGKERDGCYRERGLYQLFMHNNTLNTLLKKIATGYEVFFKTALHKICYFELESESL